MSQNIIPPDDQKIVHEVKDKLLEHFDSVRIFVTRHDGESDTTAQFDTGGGNFYAQLGQLAEWVSIQEQYQCNWANRQDKSDE